MFKRTGFKVREYIATGVDVSMTKQQVADSYFPGYRYYGVSPDSMDQKITALLCKMDGDEPESFSKLLRSEHVLSSLGDKQYSVRRSVDGWTDKQMIAHLLIEEHFSVTILIDALVDHQPTFLMLVNKLVEKNNREFYIAFDKALINTQLTQGLYDWTSDTKRRVLRQLSVMDVYAYTIQNESPSKAALILKTNETLRQKIKDEDPLKTPTNPLDSLAVLKKKFENLRFKLQLSETLNEHVSVLAEHRGYKRLVVNFMSILFTAGIANLLNRANTGNWLFFNKTTSEDNASVAEGLLNINQDYYSF